MTFVDFGMDFDVVVDININAFKYDLLLLMLMKMLKSRSSKGTFHLRFSGIRPLRGYPPPPRQVPRLT